MKKNKNHFLHLKMPAAVPSTPSFTIIPAYRERNQKRNESEWEREWGENRDLENKINYEILKNLILKFWKMLRQCGHFRAEHLESPATLMSSFDPK